MIKVVKCFVYSLILVLCMIVSTGNFNVYAAGDVPTTKWTDYVAADFDGGSGSKEDPYQIATAEQLAKLSTDVFARKTHKGEYFRLENDIDLSAHRWIPIGDYGGITYDSFEGFLDGNGKTITGMVVDQSKDKRSAGLFGYISNATSGNEVGVKDLAIANAVIYVDESKIDGPAADVSAGILVAGAMVNDGYKNTGVFENISVSGTITVQATNGYNKIGGLMGDDNRFIVKKCTTNVTITGASNAGGMTGVSANTTFENCIAKGKISGLWALGGFVGYATSSTWDDKTTESTFVNCIADVNINASNWNVGGFVGLAEFGKFQNSASLGIVTSQVTEWEARAGGFIGCAGDMEYYQSSNVTFINCHSTSTVTCDEEETRGGFAGKFVAGTVTGCSFDSEKNSKLNGFGTNKTEQQVEACTTQKNLSNICIDVYGGHHYAEEFTVDQEPTCVEEGSKSKHCIRCDISGESQVISKVDHEWDSEYIVDNEATCIEDGVKSIHCKNCDAKKDEVVIKATGHTLEWIIDKEATQTQDGSKHQVCKKGDYEGESVKIPATGSEQSSQRIFKILDGDKEIYEKTSKKTLSVEIDHDFTENVRVEVDGKQIGKDKYILTKGSTIVTLTNEYLESLSVGKHTINAYFEDGKATATFTVKEKEQPIIITTSKEEVKETENKTVSKKVNTGDNTNIMNILGLFVLSVFGFVSLRKRV